MTQVRTWSWAALAGLAVPLALAATPASAATAARAYDFDGNGKPELAIGAPTLNRGSVWQAGGVVVAGRIITQSTSKVAGTSEESDYFGSALASADFDRDGYADLAVGLPGEDLSGKADAGAVTILYGTAKGLKGTRSKQVSAPSGKVTYAHFGGAVAAGDLNGDGYADLAVGAVADRLDAGVRDDFPPSGTVTVLYGGKDGITSTGSTRLSGNRGAAWDHHFGSALAIADVDADSRPDLVVVSEGASEDGASHAGSLSFCAGTSAGPTGCTRLLHNADLRNAGPVVVGNVQGDARPEVLVGTPVTDIDSDPGSVQVVRLFGTGAGTTASASRFDQADAGLPGTGEESGDDFGAALAVGDVDGDAYGDLVVGAPGEAVGDEDAGRVFVVHGGSSGLATSGNTAYDQDTPGVPGGSEDGDGFGAAVTLLDSSGDGKVDLTVGAPGEDDGEGRVTTLPGTGGGFTTTGARAYGLASIDVNYDNRYEGSFGEVLGQ
jgi:hypothetical protein